MKTTRPKRVGFFAVICLLVSGCDSFQHPIASESTAQTAPVKRGHSLIYVPAYTYATSGGGRRIKLATTLTIHNVSAKSRITIRSVEYHDSPGEKVRSYLAEPQVLRPLQTAEFVVSEADDAPGAGANFIVSYDTAEDIQPPLVEAVMVGNTGAGWLSFTSRGVVVE